MSFPGHSRRTGFTLLEIMLVMVIILTLAAIIGPKIAGKSTTAKISATRIQIATLKTALQQFEVNAGRFPTTSEGLDALVKKPSGLTDQEWPDQYVEAPPLDAWGKPFDYKSPSDRGRPFDIVSGGPDKQIGTPDDIVNPV